MEVVVNVHEAKTQLSKLLQRVAAGEDVVIARAGKPVARLVPYASRVPDRIPGRYAGLIRITPDFDDPLPQDIQSAFEGEDDADPR